ncbi:MAG: hypothetical protein WAL26_09625, partial [Mycobacterium sp.]
MTRLRQPLPQLTGRRVFVADGGLETDLVFHDGRELPCFAAFPLLAQPETRARLRRVDGGLGSRAASGDPPIGPGLQTCESFHQVSA